MNIFHHKIFLILCYFKPLLKRTKKLNISDDLESYVDGF